MKICTVGDVGFYKKERAGCAFQRSGLDMVIDIEGALIGFARQEVVDEAARSVMALSFLDWSVCALAGRGETVSTLVRRMVEQGGSAGRAGLVGSDLRVSVRDAALVNGVTSHALDYDDTHFAHIGHPSVVAIPAALAVGQQVGATGPAVLEAALIGAEASVRVGVWLGRQHYQAGFHQTATAGTFGAMLAAGRLLDLTAEQMGHGLGLASTRAAGLKSQFGTMGKPYHAGLAAAGGVEAALLAGAGFQSNPNGLSGASGFGATHAGEANDSALDGMGKAWVFHGISHKFHACCHGLHGMLEALADLKPDFESADIVSLEIRAHPRWETVCNQPDPRTGLEAKFSFRQAAALALSGKDTGALDSFSDRLACDPALISLRNRVQVSFDAALPETAATVKLRLDDGTVRTGAHDLSHPLPLPQRRAKLMAKATALIGTTRANALWAALHPRVDMDRLQTHLMAVGHV